jgi:hypothetical protein
MQMDWITIIVLVMAGASSAVAAFLTPKRLRKGRIVPISIFILFFVGLGVLVKQWVSPAIHVWKSQRGVEKSLLQVSAYQYISKYDPKAYQQIRDEILDSIKKGEGQELATARGRKVVAALVSKYIALASDEAVIRYMDAVAREIEELASKDPEICYQFLFPERYGTSDIQQSLKPETQRADLAALADVIRTAAEQPQPEPDQKRGEESLKRFMNSFYQAHGDEALLLKDPFAPGIDKGKVCRLIASFYREVLNLPEEEGGTVLRYMLSARK